MAPLIHQNRHDVRPFPTFIAGPCVLDHEGDTAMAVATKLARLAADFGVLLTFKASYDKANRTRGSSFRGPGLSRGLELLSQIRDATGLPVTTDVHDVSQVGPVAEVVDVVQIPAFLCRQTDLLVEAARLASALNIKKGQFIAPGDVRFIVEKVRNVADLPLWVTERGTCFGHGDLVVDPRSLVTLVQLGDELGFTAVYDATHSVQQSATGTGVSSGQAGMIVPLARAAAALGVRAFFFETWPDPASGLCDAENALPLDDSADFIRQILTICAGVQTALRGTT